jgi:hypothetical protein
MPVIPECVPKFYIRPPSTTDDKGLPSDSIGNDIQRLFSLIDDERHITAYNLLTSIRNRIIEFETKYQLTIPVKTTTTAKATTTANSLDNFSKNNKENDSINNHQGTNGVNSPKKNNKLLGVVRRGSSSTLNSSTGRIVKKLTKAERFQFEKLYNDMEHVKNILERKHEAIHKLEVCNNFKVNSAKQRLFRLQSEFHVRFLT